MLIPLRRLKLSDVRSPACLCRTGIGSKVANAKGLERRAEKEGWPLCRVHHTPDL